jgi:hypothetical protein
LLEVIGIDVLPPVHDADDLDAVRMWKVKDDVISDREAAHIAPQVHPFASSQWIFG